MAAATGPGEAANVQGPEPDGSYWFELAPKATFWGVVSFLGEDMVEVTLEWDHKSKAVSGRFDGKRVAEFSCRNDSSGKQRLLVRAKSLSDRRELKPGRMVYSADQSSYVGFGYRATPVEASERHGAYPYNAVVVGFTVFGD